MVTPNNSHPGEEVRRQHLQFIHGFWQLLAYEAYRRSLTEGGGVLVVKEADFLGKNLAEINGIEIGYITKAMPEFNTILGEQEHNWIETYDAAKLVLIGVCRIDGGFSSYCMGGRPGRSPKEVFDRRKELSSLGALRYCEGRLRRS